MRDDIASLFAEIADSLRKEIIIYKRIHESAIDAHSKAISAEYDSINDNLHENSRNIELIETINYSISSSKQKIAQKTGITDLSLIYSLAKNTSSDLSPLINELEAIKRSAEKIMNETCLMMEKEMKKYNKDADAIIRLGKIRDRMILPGE